MLKKLVALLQTEEKVVLDGFPKTLEQAQHLDHLFKTHSLHKNVKFVYLDVPLEIASERIIGRRTCSSCGKLYNLITAKPINPDMCDVCQHPLIQRSCDNEQDFQKRIVLFNQTVKKVIDFYETQGILLRINFDISLEHLKKCLSVQHLWFSFHWHPDPSFNGYKNYYFSETLTALDIFFFNKS